MSVATILHNLQNTPTVESICCEYALSIDGENPIEQWKESPMSPTKEKPFVLVRLVGKFFDGESRIIAIDKVSEYVDEE